MLSVFRDALSELLIDKRYIALWEKHDDKSVVAQIGGWCIFKCDTLITSQPRPVYRMKSGTFVIPDGYLYITIKNPENKDAILQTYNLKLCEMSDATSFIATSNEDTIHLVRTQLWHDDRVIDAQPDMITGRSMQKQ